MMRIQEEAKKIVRTALAGRRIASPSRTEEEVQFWNSQEFYEKRENIWNHRGPGETLYFLKKEDQKADIARSKIQSLGEEEVIFRDGGLNH